MLMLEGLILGLCSISLNHCSCLLCEHEEKNQDSSLQRSPLAPKTVRFMSPSNGILTQNWPGACSELSTLCVKQNQATANRGRRRFAHISVPLKGNLAARLFCVPCLLYYTVSRGADAG